MTKWTERNLTPSPSISKLERLKTIDGLTGWGIFKRTLRISVLLIILDSAAVVDEKGRQLPPLGKEEKSGRIWSGSCQDWYFMRKSISVFVSFHVTVFWCCSMLFCSFCSFWCCSLLPRLRSSDFLSSLPFHFLFRLVFLDTSSDSLKRRWCFLQMNYFDLNSTGKERGVSRKEIEVKALILNRQRRQRQRHKKKKRRAQVSSPLQREGIQRRFQLLKTSIDSVQNSIQNTLWWACLSASW